jgi:hypothetical protein
MPDIWHGDIITKNNRSKTTGTSRDQQGYSSITCPSLCFMEEEKELRNRATTMRKLDKQAHPRKANWLGHLQRAASESAPKQILYYLTTPIHNTG